MSSGSLFRKRFLLNTPLTKWFPGHMKTSMRIMQSRLSQMDCLIEVHDARIPLSGRNPDFQSHLTAAKPHILLLNKKDLTDHSYNPAIEEALRGQGIDKILYTNLIHHKSFMSGFDKVLPAIIQLVRNTDRYNRSDKPEINVMIIGVPNVGKSCLINRVREQFKRGQPAKTGATAGVTRKVMERIKLCADPLIYVLDTPGILEPKVKSVEGYMKLALCSSMSDEVVGLELIADYALYWLNKNRNFSYIHHFDLNCEPSDEISEVLIRIAMKRKMFINYMDYEQKKIVPRPNLQSAAGSFVKAFRTGEFGKVMLDNDLLARKAYPHTENTLPFQNDVPG